MGWISVAFVEVIKTYQGTKVRFDVVSEERIIANIDIVKKQDKVDIGYIVDDETKYNIIITQNDNVGIIYNQMVDQVGYITAKRVKGIIKKYNYFEMYFQKISYQVYSVELQNSELLYIIYENGRQIALVEKRNENKKDIYDIFTIDDEQIEPIAIICLEDMIKYLHLKNQSSKDKNDFICWFSTRKLKIKYDHHFKEKCI